MLAEFHIVVKGSFIADYLADNTVEDYEPLNFDFPEEDVLVVKRRRRRRTRLVDNVFCRSNKYIYGNGVGVVKISPKRKKYLVLIKL